MQRKLFSNSLRSFKDNCPSFFTKRLLSTARIWSQTAKDAFVKPQTATTNGGRAVAEEDKGMTTTVCLAKLIGLALTITHGRNFFISAPCVGSKFTQ